MPGLLTGFTGFALILSVRIPPAGAQPDHAERLLTVEISSDASALSQSAIASQQAFQFEVMKQDWVRFYTAAERVNSRQSPHATDDVLLAAPENLNPGLYIPPPVPEPEPLPEEASPTETTQSSDPWWQITDLTVDFGGNLNNEGENDFGIESTAAGTLANGDRLALITGFRNFTQTGVDSVLNIPLQASWTTQMGDFTTTFGGGIDIFDSLPLGLNLNARTSVPLGDQANLSFNVEYAPYKFNAETLNNQITALRYGPDLYWQINSRTSFISSVRWGRYSDSNREQQSFSRLAHQLGDFSLAANLFNWRYRQDLEESSGYFSPPDFLVANGEVAWQGTITSWLDCRTAINFGWQRLSGTWSSVFGYDLFCAAQITEAVGLDLGYRFSNVNDQVSAYNSNGIEGRVRAKF